MSLRGRLAIEIVARARPPFGGAIEERRRQMDEAARLMPRPRGVSYLTTTLGGVPALEAVPDGADADRAMLYVHGGAYVSGSARSHAPLAGRLARAARARGWIIDYRLAPEHPYPAAVDDVCAAFRELAGSLPADRIALAGDSAGGGACLAALLALREAGDPLPGGAALLSPWVDLTMSGTSVTTHAERDPMLEADLLREDARRYAGDHPLDDPGLSPLFADLTGLPPLLVQVGTEEIFLSECRQLAERAAAAGVAVTLEVAEGMWHVWPFLAPLVPEASRAVDQVGRFLATSTGGRE